ncbi:NAD(P)-dependent oxidoreductase [Methylocucumis oryzae]|uniref:Oxidoreductase n=1 Tax=Methylocucumis oryzae TaxID=1632867 RepID=A0A0F3IMZ6_9GAMM|nr:NAD(P)-dependent oxidoreductase [Methylocucumis oryzae]KJV08100.1 oxidoreductase [Methylocucumis oryzae]
MQVGLIGLGAMGQGMAKNLAKHGYLTGVYNRTAATAQRYADELTVICYLSIARLAEAVDVIAVCVTADNDVLDIVKQVANAAKPGTVVVDMSTVSNATARQAAEILADKDIAFLDAPVSGGVEGANNGALAMMVGGDAAVLERVTPVLHAMAKRIMHMGPTGAGQATKAVNQIMCAGINQAVTEALAFAKAQALDLEKVIDVVAGGAAGNWFLDHRGKTMVNDSFKPGFKLGLHHKDLKICQTMAAASGVAIPVSDMTVNDYQQLMAQGFADEGISALYRLKR